MFILENAVAVEKICNVFFTLTDTNTDEQRFSH